MQLRRVSDGPGESTFEGKLRKFRRIVAMGVSDFTEQFVEIQLPEGDTTPIGEVFNFQVRSVTSLFQGKARLQGVVTETKPAAGK